MASVIRRIFTPVLSLLGLGTKAPEKVAMKAAPRAPELTPTPAPRAHVTPRTAPKPEKPRAPHRGPVPLPAQRLILGRAVRLKVMNTGGRHNGDTHHARGVRALARKGGVLTTLERHGGAVLVSYQGPRRQGQGEEAGHGAQFLVPAARLRELTGAVA